MGMFDTVYVHESAGLDLSCKVCGKTPGDFQSKDFDCNMGHILIARERITGTDTGVKAFRLEDPDPAQWWVEYTPQEHRRRIIRAKAKASRQRLKHVDNQSRCFSSTGGDLASSLEVIWAESETGYWKDGAWRPKNRNATPFAAGLPHQHALIYDWCGHGKCKAWNEWRLKFTDGVVVECVRVSEGEES